MKKSNGIRTERISSVQVVENVIKEYKKKLGKVVHVAINARTTFEFPAHLSQEEREVRIANYKKRHNL